MSTTPFMRLDKRHDGHEEKAKGYYNRNDQIVKILYWSIVTGIVAALAIRRFIRWHTSKKSARKARTSTKYEDGNLEHIKILHANSQQISPIIHLLRGISYPRVTFIGGYVRFISIPSQGEIIVLLLYWTLLNILLWTNVVFKSSAEPLGIKWDVIGFRAAWVSTAQLPLLYCTGCRINPISIITSISHERLNWFHRWIGRTIFLTLTIHGSFFYQEWNILHLLRHEINIRPMVIWGLAAWAAFGVVVILGFPLLRVYWYEIWLATHIAMAYVLLLLSYTHTHCTTYFVEASLGFLLFDIFGRLWLYCKQNFHVPMHWSGWIPAFGHRAEVEILDHEYLRLSISESRLDWLPGQHVYLSMPYLRAFESHPFTIHSLSSSNSMDSKMMFIIKAHSGFTKVMHRNVHKNGPVGVRTFIQGPYGSPPSLNHYDTVVFVASGNRASFTVPLLQNLTSSPGQVTKICFHLIIPDKTMLDWYITPILLSIQSAKLHGLKLDIVVHVTRSTCSSRLPPIENAALEDSDDYSIGRLSSEDIQFAKHAYISVPADDEQTSYLIDDANTTKKIPDQSPDAILLSPLTSSSSSSATSASAEQSATSPHFSRLEIPQEERERSPVSNGSYEEEKVNLLSVKNLDDDEDDDSQTKPPEGRYSKTNKIQSTTNPSCDPRFEQSHHFSSNMPTSHEHSSDTPPSTNISSSPFSSIKTQHGRPQASTIITPIVERSEDEARIMVVVASNPKLLSDVSTIVASVSRKIGLGRQRTNDGGKLGGIELWSEINGH